MYHEVPIEKLSHSQILKLLRGERIRVKHGHGHKIHASAEQHKKIMAAHRKGAGVTMQFDPYQIDLHKSHGIFGNIVKGIKAIAANPTVRHVGSELVRHAAPIILEEGKKFLQHKLEGHGEGVKKKRGRGPKVHHAHHMMHGHGEGEGMHMMHHAHHLHGSGDAGGLMSHSKKIGGGVHKRKTPKHRKTPKKHHKKHGGSLFGGDGGALMPAGYGEGRAASHGRAGRRSGHGIPKIHMPHIDGKKVLKGFMDYGVPALSTAAMFL